MSNEDSQGRATSTDWRIYGCRGHLKIGLLETLAPTPFISEAPWKDSMSY